MSQANHLKAHFGTRGDGVRAMFDVTLDNPQHDVWSALTQPDQLAQWLAPGTIELVEGGRARLDFGDSGVVIDSEVSAVQPPRLLEYGWNGPGEPQRTLRWELEPQGPLTRLVLTLTVPKNEDVARSAAGWAAHLDMLAAALAGAPIRFPFNAFQAARETYGEQLGTLAA